MHQSSCMSRPVAPAAGSNNMFSSRSTQQVQGLSGNGLFQVGGMAGNHGAVNMQGATGYAPLALPAPMQNISAMQSMQGGNGDHQPLHDLFVGLYGPGGMHGMENSMGVGRLGGLDGPDGLLGTESGMVSHQQQQQHRQMESSDLVQAEENLFGQSFGEGSNVADVSMENNVSLPKDGKGFEHSFDHHQGVDLPSDYNFSTSFDLGIEPPVPLGPSIDLLDEDLIWYFGA